MMGSWKLGDVLGIGVYVHSTFLLLIGFVGLSSWLEARTLAGVAGGIAFILALFGSVLLHEFGHALSAKKYGIPTRDITLLPIGGVARLERMPDEPRQEFWVALAGPAVNVVIAAVLFFWLQATAAFGVFGQLGITQGSFVERLMMVNISLVLFNLLPAFPMDGGRVLRALLAMRVDYVRATQLAAGLGQLMAFVLGFVGLLTNPFLVFIALFVWIGAGQEAAMVRARLTPVSIPVGQDILTDYRR